MNNEIKELVQIEKLEHEKLSKRQADLLKYIIENHNIHGEAIGSHFLKDSLLKKISSATIRNEMVFLEKKGFLKKEHKSSGRIPTQLGYIYYVKNLMATNLTKKYADLNKKLVKIFNNRHNSIDVTIDKTAQLITEFVNLPVVVTKIHDEETEVLKKIDIVHISKIQFMIFVITSESNVLKYFVEITNNQQAEDIEACLRIFNERLVDVPIHEIKEHIESLTKVIREKVHEYEFIFEKIISQIIINLQTNLKKAQNWIYNAKSLVNQPEIQKHTIQLEKVLELLENTNIFTQLSFNHKKTGKTLINFNNEIKGISIAATKIENYGNKHQISIVGPTRMDYQLINHVLEFLNEKLSNKK